MFNNDLSQHLSIAIFHVKNGLIHNYSEFYKWEWLIHVWFRTNFIRSNKKGVGTLIKIGLHTLMEHEQENTIQKNYHITNFQTKEIPHSMCVVFVSISCIWRYLQYFGLLYIDIWIAKKVKFQNFRFCIICKIKSYTSKWDGLSIFHDFIF
jgi:hypothetical protein